MGGPGRCRAGQALDRYKNGRISSLEKQESIFINRELSWLDFDSRVLALATVALAVSSNLLQLLLLPLLHTGRPALVLPLASMCLAAGLMLLCRCLQRGRELQEDSDSII